MFGGAIKVTGTGNYVFSDADPNDEVKFDDDKTVKSAGTRLFEDLAITGTAFDDLVVQRLTVNDGNEGNKCAMSKIDWDSLCANNSNILVLRKDGCILCDCAAPKTWARTNPKMDVQKQPRASCV